jgi:hypothetical protein
MKKALTRTFILMLTSAVCLGTAGILIAQGQNEAGASGKFEVAATLPSSGPTENICQTTDGSFYVTGIDDRILWKVSPNGMVDKFFTLPSVSALVGVATDSNGFVVIAFGKPFRKPAPPPQPGAAATAGPQIDFSDVDPQIVVLDKTGKMMGDIHGQMGQAFNGIALAGKGWYLAADSNAGTLWRVDPAKKKIEAWLKDEVFDPVKPPVPGGANGGANGIKVHNGWVYVSSRGAIYRVEIDPKGLPKGKPELFAQARADDFAIAPDGTIYIPGGPAMNKVTPTGEVVKFLDGVPGGPAAWVSNDGKWVYWPTRGGNAPQRLLRAAIP